MSKISRTARNLAMNAKPFILVALTLLISFRAVAVDFTSFFGGKRFTIDRAAKLAKMADNETRLKQIKEWEIEVIFADVPAFKKVTFLDGKEVPQTDVDLIREGYLAGTGDDLTAAAFYMHDAIGALSNNGKILDQPFKAKPFMVVNTELKPLQSSTLVHEFLHHGYQNCYGKNSNSGKRSSSRFGGGCERK